MERYLLKTRYIALLLLLIISQNCTNKEKQSTIVASSYPVMMILKEITGDEIDIICLMPPGSSPHTYSPRPSDIYAAQKARAVFYIADNMDGWAMNLPSQRKVSLVNILPKSSLLHFRDFIKEETGHAVDPHFWTDPLTVEALCGPLTEQLCSIDPAHAAKYKQNAANFSKKLIELDKQIGLIVSGIKNAPVYLFHPSFLYFIRRYNLTYGGAIETSPGKEPTASYLTFLINQIRQEKVKAIFSEPQLSEKPAETLAESAGIKVFMLDPIGGVDGRKSYFDLMLYNARELQKALE